MKKSNRPYFDTKTIYATANTASPHNQYLSCQSSSNEVQPSSQIGLYHVKSDELLIKAVIKNLRIREQRLEFNHLRSKAQILFKYSFSNELF